MSSILAELESKQLIKPPPWMSSNTMYLTIMGSIAYGTSSDSSDYDLYGFCIPRKEVVFPHMAGVIKGFGNQGENFEQWQQHGIVDKSALGGKGKTYDFTIFSIVRYFDLLASNNPNILDSIWTPQECVLHCTQVGNMVRENRKLFLSKRCFVKLKGYAFSQLHKMNTKEPEGKRKKTVDEYGFDTKYAYHLIRLLSEAEQLLMYGDMDIRQNNEQLKAIRRGEFSEVEVKKLASDKERYLEELYVKSKLPEQPDENRLKQLLLDCLESHYGSLSAVIERPDKYLNITNEIKNILERNGV